MQSKQLPAKPSAEVVKRRESHNGLEASIGAVQDRIRQQQGATEHSCEAAQAGHPAAAKKAATDAIDAIFSKPKAKRVNAASKSTVGPPFYKPVLDVCFFCLLSRP